MHAAAPPREAWRQGRPQQHSRLLSLILCWAEPASLEERLIPGLGQELGQKEREGS